MDNIFALHQSNFPSSKEYFYTHRVRASLYYSTSLSTNDFTNKLLNLYCSKFIISTCNKVYQDFKDYRYSPLEIKISLPKNGTGSLHLKHWGFIDYIKGAIHIDGEYPEKRVQEFLSILRENDINLTIIKTDYKYVEVCCRHSHDSFDKVSEAITKLGSRFSVPKTIDDRKRQPLTKEVYQHIVKDMYLDGYCNLKTYKYVNKFGSSNPSISKSIEPKLEYQINDPQSLEEAQQRGISILKAITTSLGISPIKMDREFEKSEYTEVPNSEKYGPDEKILFILNEKELDRLPDLPDAIRNHKNSYRIVSSIYFIPKRTEQLKDELNVSKSTITRTLKRLGNLVEKRGDRRNGYLLTIDKTLLKNNYELSGVIRHTSTSRKNTGKALVITLLLIIGTNIFFYHYFSHFNFSSSRVLMESFRHGTHSLYSLFNSELSSLETPLMKSLINNSALPNRLLIISELN